MKSDKEFYASGKHSMGGSEMIKINGQWYEKTSIDYIKSQKKKSTYSDKVKDNPQKKIEDSTNFQKKKTVDNDYEKGQELTHRLVLIQGEIKRLTKLLEHNKKVEGFILEDLKNIGIIK